MARDPVTVDIGYDRFTFDLILAKAKASGVQVWPLQMDQQGLAPGFVALAPHKIMVRPKDLPALRDIIAEVQPPAATASEATLPWPKRLLRRFLTSFRL